MDLPYWPDLVEDFLAFNLRSDHFFRRLSDAETDAFEKIKRRLSYPAGATVFVEQQECQGLYILCTGRVKLSATSREGQTLIIKIAKPGDVLGLNETVLGTAHDTTAEAGKACQFDFVKRADFVQFLNEHADACVRTAVHLSQECQQAYQQLHSFAMRSAGQRIARLLLGWSQEENEGGAAQRIEVALTHAEIGQITGMSREAVSSTLANFRLQQIAELDGSTLLIEDVPALRKAATQGEEHPHV